MKKITSLLLTIVMLISMTSTMVFAENENNDSISEPQNGYEVSLEENFALLKNDNENKGVSLFSLDSGISPQKTETTRYTVLALDTSGSMYGTPMNVAKAAATKFCTDILKADGHNYVALITLNSNSSIACNFTDDISTISAKINSLSADGGTNINDALIKSNSILEAIAADKVIKNIVLLSDGLPQSGSYSYAGHYTSSDYYDYEYANTAYATAQTLKSKYNIYSLGFFHSLSGDELAFGRTLMTDLQNSGYYDVTNVDDLEFKFGDISEDITLVDSDGDGLYDEWEINGIDTDNDGVVDLHIEKMGADPNVPDIFVEVDWMIQPQKKVLFVETQPETSLAPNQETMEIVYNAFKSHGINIHIDVGPESIDFVTGKQWGDLSGGNQIPYEENFELGSDYSHWNDVANNNFDVAKRGNVFRHAMFVNTYNGGTSSGIANDIPGQYFIIANQDWVRKTGNTGIAGTFMHELGHTLGLSHGGHNHNNENNHTHYKPNYLSIMNYLFQTSGLVGTNDVNYSEYSLPDLNENYLIEQNGIDPDGLTEGTGLGTKIKKGSFWGFDKEITPISKKSVDYNNLWGIDKNPVDVDLNADGKKEILTSSNDWEHIIYKGGNIGEKKQIIHIAGIDPFSDEEKLILSEVDLEERLKNGLLGNKGSANIEHIGPFTILSEQNKKKTQFNISNLATEADNFTINIEHSEAVDEQIYNIEVPGSTDTSIGSKIIDVNINDNLLDGTYDITVKLTNSNHNEITKKFSITIYTPTNTELSELKNLLNEDNDIPENILTEYKTLLGINLLLESTYGGKIVGTTKFSATENQVFEIEAEADSGYVFTGWTSSNGGMFENASSLKTNFTMPANDTTVTANFKKKSSGGGGTTRYSVSFETNGGSTIAKQTVIRNSKIDEPTIPTKEGFEFEGWYTDKELKTEYDFSNKITKSMTLYAKWSEKDISANQIILTIGEKFAQVFGQTKSNDVAPKIVNDRTMLPARFVAENLGAKVEWNGEKELVTITGKNLKTGEDVTILITIGATTAKVNGKEVKLDSPAFIENDRTYTPIRFISEELGASIEWVEKEQKVIITKTESQK